MTPEQRIVRCHLCDRPYGNEHGFPDLVLPNDVWKKISPSGDDGGMLCPSCICQRLHEEGLEYVTFCFRSGPLANLDATTVAELKGYQEGFELAHEPAKCGHARGNWKDPAWGTSEYAGDERCEACAAVQAERTRCAGIARGYMADWDDFAHEAAISARHGIVDAIEK